MKAYFELIKLRYHITYSFVILGAIYGGASVDTILPLLMLYFIFNILLYGGIYTVNDVLDVQTDKKHPKKSKRPLPSKRIKISSAMLFALAFIGLGLFFSFLLFGKTLLFIHILFLLLNVFYTFIGKKYPYLELISNAVTHPLRFVMGIVLVNSELNILFISSLLLAAIGGACIRRIIEKDVKGWQSRKTLRYYGKYDLIIIQVVCFLMILIMTVLYFDFWYFTILTFYFLGILGIHFIPFVRKLYRDVWTR